MLYFPFKLCQIIIQNLIYFNIKFLVKCYQIFYTNQKNKNQRNEYFISDILRNTLIRKTKIKQMNTLFHYQFLCNTISE